MLRFSFFAFSREETSAVAIFAADITLLPLPPPPFSLRHAATLFRRYFILRRATPPDFRCYASLLISPPLPCFRRRCRMIPPFAAAFSRDAAFAFARRCAADAALRRFLMPLLRLLICHFRPPFSSFAMPCRPRRFFAAIRACCALLRFICLRWHAYASDVAAAIVALPCCLLLSLRCCRAA